MNTGIIGIVAFTGLIATAAQAGSFSFELRVNAERATCAEQKAWVEKKLLDSGEALGKGLKNIQVHCLQSFSTGAYLMSVRYQVDAGSLVYTAHWGSGSLSTDTGTSRGIFESDAECRAEAPDEIAAYERQTGLKMQFWGCTPQTYGTGSILSVTGFGVPKSRLQMVEFRSGMLREADLSAQEFGFMRGYLSSKGAELRASNGGRFLYFSPTYHSVTLSTVSSWNDPAQCTEQLGEAAEIFARNPHLAGCHTTMDADGKTWTEMRAIYGGWELFQHDFGTRSARYSSFESCREFLPEVKAAMRAENPSAVLGGVCVAEVGGTGRYLIRIWSRY